MINTTILITGLPGCGKTSLASVIPIPWLHIDSFTAFEESKAIFDYEMFKDSVNQLRCSLFGIEGFNESIDTIIKSLTDNDFRMYIYYLRTTTVAIKETLKTRRHYKPGNELYNHNITDVELSDLSRAYMYIVEDAAIATRSKIYFATFDDIISDIFTIHVKYPGIISRRGDLYVEHPSD